MVPQFPSKISHFSSPCSVIICIKKNIHFIGSLRWPGSGTQIHLYLSISISFSHEDASIPPRIRISQNSAPSVVVAMVTWRFSLFKMIGNKNRIVSVAQLGPAKQTIDFSLSVFPFSFSPYSFPPASMRERKSERKHKNIKVCQLT